RAPEAPRSGRNRRSEPIQRTSRPVGRVLSFTRGERAIIHLGLSLPTVSCGLPAGSGGPPSGACAAGTRGAWPPFDLAPGGVYLAVPVTRRAGGLLHHPFTLTGGLGPSAVCFLWHCPAGHPGWALPTTLPCGARTFLDGSWRLRRDRPAG